MLIKSFVAAFFTILVATNAITVVPVYAKTERKKILSEITVTTAIVGSVFVLVGNYLFMAFNVNIGQFEIAGGIILFLLSVKNILMKNIEDEKDTKIGVIPIAIPLILGPGALTALITLRDVYPIYIVLLAFLVNVMINHIVLEHSEKLFYLLTDRGVLIMEKLMALMFASYAVMLVEKGIKLYM